MGEHVQKSHDLHEFDGIAEPTLDGTYYLKVVKSGASLTYEYVDSVDIGDDLSVTNRLTCC